MSTTHALSSGGLEDDCADAEAVGLMNNSMDQWFIAAETSDESYIRTHMAKYARKRNRDGFTALMIAAKFDFSDIISILVEAEGGERNTLGLTALCLQILSGHPINEELFAKESNIKTDHGASPLHFACLVDNLDALQFLIKQLGSDTSGDILYLLDISIANESTDCFEYLLDKLRNIPDSYLTRLAGQIKTKNNINPKFMSILSKYKPELNPIVRCHSTSYKSKKQTKPDHLQSSLRRSTSANPDFITEANTSPFIKNQDNQKISNELDEIKSILGPQSSPQERALTLSNTLSIPSATVPNTAMNMALSPPSFSHSILESDALTKLTTKPENSFNLSLQPSRVGPSEDPTVGQDPLHASVQEHMKVQEPSKIEDDTGCRDNHSCCMEVALLMDQCHKLKNTSLTLREDKDVLTLRILTLEKKIAELEVQLAQAHTNNDELQKALNEAKSVALPPAPSEFHSLNQVPQIGTVSIPGLEGDTGSLSGRLKTYILKTEVLEREKAVLQAKLNENTLKIHSLERDIAMKGRLNQLLAEDNRRSREQSRCNSILSYAESMHSPGESMAVGLDDSIMEILSSKIGNRSAAESSILRRKVAELRGQMRQMLEDLETISRHSIKLLPEPVEGGVLVVNLKDRAARLEERSDTDSVITLFKRNADLIIDCLTYINSVQKCLSPGGELSRSKSRGRRAPSRSLFGAFLHKIGFRDES